VCRGGDRGRPLAQQLLVLSPLQSWLYSPNLPDIRNHQPGIGEITGRTFNMWMLTNISDEGYHLYVYSIYSVYTYIYTHIVYMYIYI